MEKKADNVKQKQLDIFTQLEIKMDNSTNILDDMRVSPFLPLTKISKNTTTYKKFIENKNVIERDTAWGKIKIRNRLLTQTHKDLLNAIYTLSTLNKTKKFDKSKRIVLTFSRYEVIKKLQMNDGGVQYKLLDDWLSEIKDTVIERVSSDEKQGLKYNIIDYVGWIDDEYGIILSDVYSKNFITSYTLNLTNRIDELIAIKGEGCGVIKSIIDHFITHDADINKKVNINLNKLIQAINYPIDSAKQLSALKSLLKKYKPELNSFGISFDTKSQNFSFIGAENIAKYPPLNLEDKKA